MVKNYHIVTFYICLLAFISGVFAVGQILGIINLYINWIAISMAILLSVVFGIILLKSAFQSLIGMLNKQDRIVLPKWVNIVAYGSGALILFAVLLLPLGFWPFSGIEHQLIWDAGLYHLPKAAIMVTTGSSWDLSIAYGEYPFGFESLIAFSFLFSRSGYLIGLVHAIILLFFICSLFLLTCKYSRIPVSYAFLLVVFLVASYDIFRLLSSNPFQYLRIIAFTIGMNDLFMASLIIASLLFIPINIGKNNKDYSLLGFAIISMLIIGTKPNGGLILIFGWILIFFYEIRGLLQSKENSKQFLFNWLGVLLLNGVGLLWVFRNLIAQGVIIKSDSLWIQQFSILANLTNPYFYTTIDLKLKAALLLLVALIVLAIVRREVSWTIPVSYAILIFTFIMTPTSAFFGNTQQAAKIAWRLGIYIIAYEIPALLLILDPFIMWLGKIEGKKYRLIMNVSCSIIFAAIALYGTYINRSRLILNESNTIALRDIYEKSVGVNGYYSAYDYIQKNVSNSIVWVENGLPYLMMGSDLSNSISRKIQPDYWVFFKTAWNNAGGYPKAIEKQEWSSQWNLIYADSEGRVYKRNNKE